MPVKTFQSFCNTLLPTPNASALSFCTCKGRSGLQQAANWLDAKPNARLLCNPSPARSREHLQCEKHLKNESESWSYSLCVCLDFSLLKTGTVPHQSDSSIAHHPSDCRVDRCTLPAGLYYSHSQHVRFFSQSRLQVQHSTSQRILSGLGEELADLGETETFARTLKRSTTNVWHGRIAS